MSITFKKNGKFVPSHAIIASKNGKMCWNQASAEFRSLMRELYFARYESAAITVAERKKIKDAENAKTFLLGSLTHNPAQIVELDGKIKESREIIRTTEKRVKTLEESLSAPVEGLYYAYRAYINGEEDSSDENYYRAFMEWAHAYSLVPSQATFNYISKKIGVRKLSASAVVKNDGNAFTGALTAAKFVEMFYLAILQIHVDQKLVRPATPAPVAPATSEPAKKEKTEPSEQAKKALEMIATWRSLQAESAKA